MKNRIVAAILVAASCAASAQNQQQPQQVQVGRYQLMQGTFTASPELGSKPFTATVLLDTATGIISRCDYTYSAVVMPNGQ